MKALQKILFALVLTAGLSVAAFAQKGDKKPPPKKDPPPVINPGKDKQPDPPKKKPGELEFALLRHREERSAE